MAAMRDDVIGYCNDVLEEFTGGEEGDEEEEGEVDHGSGDPAHEDDPDEGDDHGQSDAAGTLRGVKVNKL